MWAHTQALLNQIPIHIQCLHTFPDSPHKHAQYGIRGRNTPSKQQRTSSDIWMDYLIGTCIRERRHNMEKTIV